MIKEFLRKTGLYIPDKMELHEVMRRLLKDNLSFGLPMAVLTAATGLIYFFVYLGGVDYHRWLANLVLTLGSAVMIIASIIYRKHPKAQMIWPGWISFFVYFFACSFYGMSRSLYTFRFGQDYMLSFMLIVIWCFGIFEMYPLASLIYGAALFYGMFYLMRKVGIYGYDPVNWIMFYAVTCVLSTIRYSIAIKNVYASMEIEVRTSQLEYLSARDGLTGLYNRFCLREKFDGFLNKTVIVAMMDIDDFKHYNDDFGHDYGDYILKLYAKTAQHSFDNADIFRYGGDEILIVSRQPRDIFEREIVTFGRELKLGFSTGSDVTPTFSLGYVRGKAKDQNSLRRILKQADKNLYDIKHENKDSFKGSEFEG